MPTKRWNQEEESVQFDSEVTTWLLFCRLFWITYANKGRKTAKEKTISRRWKKQQGESMLSSQLTTHLTHLTNLLTNNPLTHLTNHLHY